MPDLGTIYNPAIGTSGTLTSGVAYAEITLSPGIYINTFSFQLNYSVSYTSSFANITLVSGTGTVPSSNMFYTGSVANFNSFIISGTFFVRVTATSVLRANVTFTASVITQGTNSFWQAIRIG